MEGVREREKGGERGEVMVEGVEERGSNLKEYGRKTKG